MDTSTLLALLKAIATANHHPDPEAWAQEAANAFVAPAAAPASAPAVTTTPAV